MSCTGERQQFICSWFTVTCFILWSKVWDCCRIHRITWPRSRWVEEGWERNLKFGRGSGNLPFSPGCLIKAIESRSTDQYYCFGLPTTLFFCCLPCSNTVRLKKKFFGHCKKLIKAQISFIGVRSLSFRDLLLTVGTGCGSLFFFDMRAYKFLRNAESTMICFKSGKGWLVRKSTMFSVASLNLKEA